MYIAQRNAWDCGVACLAMALGLTYEDALEDLGRDPADELPGVEGERYAGVLPSEMSAVAFKRGVLCHVSLVPQKDLDPAWQHVWRDVFCHYTLDDVSHHAFVAQRPTILGVPALRNPDDGHWIAIIDGKVLDPAPGRAYEARRHAIDVQAAVLLKVEDP